MSFFKFISALIASVFFLEVHGQSPKIDSLKSQLDLVTDVNEKVQTLQALTNQFQNPNDKLVYARQGYALLEEASTKNKIESSTDMAICMGMLGRLDSSRYYFMESLNWSKEEGDSLRISSSYNGLGNITRMQGALDESLDYSLKALDFSEAAPKLNWRADILTNVSGLYYTLHEYGESLIKINEAREIYVKLNDTAGIGYSANLLAIVHRALGNFDEAFDYNQEALSVLVKNKDTIQIIYSHVTTTEILMEQGKYDEATLFAQKTLKLAREFSDHGPEISSLLTLARLDFRKGELIHAEKYANEALDVAVANDLKSQLSSVYTMKSLIAAAAKDYSSAIELAELRQTMEDSVRSQAISERIADLKVTHETEKKESEILRLNAVQGVNDLELRQARIVNGFLLAVSVLVIILLVVSWYFYRQRLKISEQLQAANSAKDRLLSVVAHDIKNPLSAMKGLSNLLVEDYKSMPPDQVELFITTMNSSTNKLFELLQNLLEWSISASGGLSHQAEKLTLSSVVQEAIDLFQGAVEVKKLNIENKIPLDMEVMADYKMLFSVIRNLLSNAIKFTPASGVISFDSSATGEMVELTVSDTGMGIPEEKKSSLFDKSTTKSETGMGLGLVLCKEFVERNGGKIWAETSAGEGASFKFTLKKID